MDAILNSWWRILDDPEQMILYIVAALLSAVAFYLMYRDGKKEKAIMEEEVRKKMESNPAKNDKSEKMK